MIEEEKEEKMVKEEKEVREEKKVKAITDHHAL